MGSTIDGLVAGLDWQGAFEEFAVSFGKRGAPTALFSWEIALVLCEASILDVAGYCRL
jgi:hypothetical protein